MIAAGVPFPQMAIDNLGLSCSEAPYFTSSFEGNPQHLTYLNICSIIVRSPWALDICTGAKGRLNWNYCWL